MLEIIALFVVAILQGFLEWWPVSSEGQISLILLTGVVDPAIVLSLVILLHLGTMAVVLVVYRHQYAHLILAPRDTQLSWLLFLSLLGTGITGVPLYLIADALFSQASRIIMSIGIGILLISTGIILWYTKKSAHLEAPRTLYSLSKIEMLFLGIFQGIAILPGISRSGMTLAFLLTRRIEKKEAVQGSFLISVPAVLGALSVDILTGGFSEAIFVLPINIMIICIGITFIVGLISMRLLLKLSKKLDFAKFCLFLGSTVILIEVLTFLLGTIGILLL